MLKISLHYYQYRKYKNGKQQMRHTIAIMAEGKLLFAVAMTCMLNMHISTFSSAPTNFTTNDP
jgi:hypothetical protein